MSFTVNIYTPSKVMGKGIPADFLLVPTCKGEIQVLPEHTHLITKLEIGILTLKKDSKVDRLLVTQGICKILGQEVTILSKTCERVEDVDEKLANEMVQEIYNKIVKGTDGMTDEELEQLQHNYILANTRLKFISSKG